MPDCFPRTKDVPKQSPLFWATHKDRYLRQLLIGDIEAITQRDLLVYFTDTDNTTGNIDPGDDQFLFELLNDQKYSGTDLLLETPGGYTDTTEKLCSMLRSMCSDLRVIVPRKAKSNGTVIALAASEILMSTTSELGPIDPAIQNIPAEFILNDPTTGVLHKQLAQTAIAQTKRLATELLRTGMMSGKTNEEIRTAVETLSTRQVRYHSHGSVIDAAEARALGLSVTECAPDDDMWSRIWLLRTMYAYDAPRNGHSKIFEGARVSTAVSAKAG